MSGSRTVKIDILSQARNQGFADSERAADSLGSKLAGLGKFAAVGIAGIGVAAAGAVTGLYKIGTTFDEAFDTIRTGTGATGDALAGLQEDFKGVFTSVPTDVDSAATAISELNTRLGLTGEPLQNLSEQFINLSRVTGVDLSSAIAAGTRVFGDWSIATEDQGKSLDYLFKVSQNTGIGVDSLMEKVVQFGAPLRQMGFSFEESAALMGKWEKEGVNAELVLGSMRIALGKFAQEGVTDTRAAFESVITNIQNAGSAGEATALAMETFGAKAGPDMAAAIREGRFSLEDMIAMMEGSTETINGAAEDTADFAEKWILIKNKVLTALQPAGAKVLEFATIIADKAIPIVDRLVQFAGTLADTIRGPTMAAFNLARDGVLTFVQAISGNWTDDSKIHPLHRAIGMIGSVIHDQVIPAVLSFVDFAQERLLPIFQSAIGMVGKVVDAFGDGGIGGVFRSLPGILGPHLQLVADLFLDLAQKLIDWVEPMIPPLLEKLGSLLQQAVDWLRGTGLTLFGEAMQSLGESLWSWVQANVDPLLEQLGVVLTQARDWLISDGIPLVQEALATYTGPILEQVGLWFIALGDWIINTGIPLVAEKLIELGKAFIAWVEPLVEPLLEALGALLSQLGSWLIDTALPTLAEKLAEWGKAFVAWVAPQIVPLLTELGLLYIEVEKWLLTEALPAIVEKLLEWGKAFVAWVGPQIPPLLVELGKLLLEVGTWLIGTALPDLMTKLGEWALAFIAWVAPQIPPLLVELGSLLISVNNWLITTALPEIVSKLGEWALAFLDWVATGVLPFLGEKLAEILTALLGWMGDGASGATKSIIDKLVDWSTAFVDWVDDAVANLPTALDGILTAITGWVTEKLEALGAQGTRIGNAVVGPIKSIIGGIIGAINGVISSINSALSFSVSVPDWVPVIGGNSWSFSPNLPSVNNPWGGSSAESSPSAQGPSPWVPGTGPTPQPHPGAPPGMTPGTGTGQKPLPPPPPPPPGIGDAASNGWVNPLYGTGNLSGGSGANRVGGGKGGGNLTQQQANTVAQMVSAGVPADQAIAAVQGAPTTAGGGSYTTSNNGVTETFNPEDKGWMRVGSQGYQDALRAGYQVTETGGPDGSDPTLVRMSMTDRDAYRLMSGGSKSGGSMADHWSGNYAFDSMHDYRRGEDINGLGTYIPVSSDGIDIGRLDISGLLMSQVNGRRHMWNKGLRRSPNGQGC